MFTGESLQIGYLTQAQMASVSKHLLSLNVSYSMDMANQLSFTIIDPGFVMGTNNYFQIGMDVVYETMSIDKVRIAGDDSPIITRIKHLYEISNISVSQQSSSSPIWSVEAMPKAVQQMKRDKKPEKISGSGYTFAQKAARKYGLKFVGEKSSRIKHESKNSGDGQSDSVWTVLKSIADASQYMLFVQDGVMYFGSQKWLMYKWGNYTIKGKPKKDKKGKVIINKKTGKPEMNPDRYYIPLEYRGYTQSVASIEVMQLPNMSLNENDPMEVTGSMVVSRKNGVQLRPGMTIRNKNIPNMDGFYLITSVSFSEQTTDPVSIEFRTPERLRKEDGKEPDIPLLPVGQIFESEYKIKRPIFGASAVGAINVDETIPRARMLGTTIVDPTHKSGLRTPNARRPFLELLDAKTVTKYIPHGMNKKDAINALENDGISFPNIDVYNRPLYRIQNENGSKVVTSFIYIYNDVLNSQYVLCEGVQCSGGQGVLLEEADAVNLYVLDGVHSGIFETEKSAKIWRDILYNIQYKHILPKRFGKSIDLIHAGNVDPYINQIGACTGG